MVQLLPDLERKLVRRGFKILPCFIVMNFVEREWSMCSVNWISRGPEAWVQMRSTSTVWRPSVVKDTKHWPWGRKCWRSCKWGEASGVCMDWRLRTSLQYLLTLWTEILESILLLHDALKCKAQQTNQKSFFIDNATTTYSLFCASEELVSGGWSHSHENYMSKENIWVQWK